MGYVEVRDHALWAKHIHGDDALKERIVGMSEGALIDLVVDGVRGKWKKMDDGSDGRPTDGLKAIGPALQHWNALQDSRGELVTIRRG